MQRLASRHLLARLCGIAERVALPSAPTTAPPSAPTTVQQQLPCLASLAGSVPRWSSTGATEPPGDGDAAEPNALAAAADGGDADASADASDSETIELDLDDYELTDRGLDQALKFRGGVPDRRGRKPTRAEKGSYIDDGDLQRELEDIAIKVPDDISLYNLRDAAPGIYMPRSDALEELIRYGREHMDEVLGDVGLHDDMDNPLHAGRRPILRWTVRMRLDTSGESNPAVNRKAVCKVYLRELQEEAGLTDAALQHIARVCGQRYHPDNGELTLISERYPEREENRMHIMDMLNALIAEGERVHPSDQAAEDGQKQQQQAAHAGAE